MVLSFDTANVATLSLVVKLTGNLGARGIAISDVIVGPGQIVNATPISNWETFTATTDIATNATITAAKRRVGSSLEMRISVQATGATTGSFDFTLPDSLTIDTAVVPNATANENSFGYGSLFQGSGGRREVWPAYATTTKVRLLYENDTGSSAVLSTSAPFTWASGDNVTFFASIPIAEWAGAPNYAGSNDVIYISNDGTNTIQGPQGSLVPNQAFTTGFTSRTITLPRALQAGEIPQVFISNAGNGFSENYYPFASGNNAGTTNFYGVRVLKTGATTVRVDFGNQGTRVSSSSASNGDTPWSTEFTNGTRFLVVIGQAGNTVGFGAATQTSLGLVKAGQVPGTNTNDNAVAGNVGEYKQASASGVNAGSSSSWKTITSIELEPGDWEFFAQGTLSTNSATLSGLNTIAIGTTDDGDPGLSVGISLGLARFNNGAGSSSFSSMPLAGYRVQPTTTTTYYLVGQVAYSAGTPQWRGIISARRVR
jgi:hypothetical protein